MLTHDELKQKMLNNPQVKAEYDSLKEEFSLFDALLEARMRAGLTQAEVAARMGIKAPAIARLEVGGGSKQHFPSISTLQKYARAVDCSLEIRLVHN